MNGMESELHSLTNIHISGMSFEARPCTERREAYDYGGEAIEGALGHTAFHFHFKAAGLVCEQALRSRSSSITPSLGMQYYSLFRSYRRISVEKVHFYYESLALLFLSINNTSGKLTGYIHTNQNASEKAC